jgi:hypothetical protein
MKVELSSEELALIRDALTVLDDRCGSPSGDCAHLSERLRKLACARSPVDGLPVGHWALEVMREEYEPLQAWCVRYVTDGRVIVQCFERTVMLERYPDGVKMCDVTYVKTPYMELYHVWEIVKRGPPHTLVFRLALQLNSTG